MDLPTCPACGQSVIDDEATECPFCGASMSGGGGAPPKSPAQAAPRAGTAAAKPAGSAAAQPTAGKPKSTASRGASDTGPDEIGVDEEARRNAVPVSPRPTKARTLKVVCPMCETEGYIPERVAGRDVKCANPECLVPIFTAPEPEPEAEPEPERRSLLSPGVLLVVGILVISVGAASIWYSLQKSQEIVELGPSEIPEIVTYDTPTFDDPGPEEEPVGANDPGGAAGEVTPESAQQQVFERMVSLSLQNERNRSKPFCRQMTALAYIDAGQLDAAREQMDSLQKVGRQVPFYQIAPLVGMGWKQLEAGDAAAAGMSASQAQELSAQLPRVGRASIDDATALATLLAALEQYDEARNVVQRFATPDSLGMQSAIYQMAKSRQTFDVAQVAELRPVLNWKNPQFTVITSSLVARGYPEQALEWAKSLPDEIVRQESLVAYVEERSFPTGQTPSDVQAIADALSPAGRALMWGRLAVVQQALEQTGEAEQSLAAVAGAIAAMPEAEPFAMPGSIREVMESQVPSDQDGRLAAAAHIEIGRAQAAFGNRDAAWESLRNAIAAARRLGPNPTLVQAAVQEFESAGTTSFRQRVRTELDLRSDDEARRRTNDYRKTLFDLRDAAARRTELQIDLLKAAVEWNVLDRLWDFVLERNQGSGDEPAEPFLNSTLPAMILHQYTIDGNTERVNLVQNAVPNARTDELFALRQELEKHIAAKEWVEISQPLQAIRSDTAARDLLLTVLASRLVNEGRIADARSFTARVPFPLVREDAYELLAGQAAALGKWREIWQRSGHDFGEATEEVAYWRGMIAGMYAPQPETAEVAALGN